MNNIDLMNYWINSANNDFDTIKVLYDGKKYIWSLFIGHLVIEKLLKALYAKNNKDNPYAPKIHDLLFLASKIPLELTEEQENLLITITRFNIDGRYDDYKNSFYKLCTEEYTRESINKITIIRDWLTNLLSEESEDKEDEK